MSCPPFRRSVSLGLLALTMWLSAGCGGGGKPAADSPAVLTPSLSKPGAVEHRFPHYLEERGPVHQIELFLFLQAYREIHPSGEVLYFVDCNSVKLSPETVRSFLQSFEQARVRKKSSSRGVEQAIVHWDLPGAVPNTSIRFSHQLGSEAIGVGLIPIKSAPTALQQVLDDVEALRMAKPSFTW